MQALFIVFEGIDSSGKSTQAKLLQDYYLSVNQPAILSPEPTDGPIGQFIRNILHQQINLEQNQDNFEQQMSYLFAADRYYHLYNQTSGVFTLLQQQITIISTRYYFSSLAYHGHSLKIQELVKRLNQDFPQPDLLIYLDIPLEVSLARLQDKSQKDVYENKQKLNKVQANYQQIVQEYSGLKLVIDARKSQEEIHQQIVHFIEKNFS
ncbi:MAG: dTMP kinase [Gloeocapsa sp. DLM2.Bin57]|nr:MAG: dTMP kinase [Gloeocapsa sp. DLM2.Bin57]